MVHVIGRMEYIGLVRRRDVMRVEGREKNLGDRATTREVNIVEVWKGDE